MSLRELGDAPSTTADPALQSESTRAQQDAGSTRPLLLLPAETKEHWEKGGAVLSMIQLTGFP